MAELTVSMPAYNTERFIEGAIESVLRQKGVDYELIVVDDGSQDGTAEVVQSFDDARVRLIRNESRMGIAYCHNRVIEHSRSPFIAHVDSDDMLLPGALAKMVEKLKSSPDIGQAHCHFFDVDEQGRTTREAFRKRRRWFLQSRTPGMDYRRELLVFGSVMNALRTYRREVFETVGTFNEALRWGEDWEMALRILNKYDIGLVPEFLYARRLHEGNTWESLRFKGLRSWSQRFLIARRLRRSHQVGFLRQQQYDPRRLLLLGLCHILRLPEMAALFSIPRRAVHFAARHLLAPVLERAYDLAVNHLSWWPIKTIRSTKGAQKRRFAYYLWRFPTLSETFIRREIAALDRSGLDVQVIADAPGDLHLLDQKAESPAQRTHYLLPEDEGLFLKYRSRFRAADPLLYLSSFLNVVLCRYGSYKTLREDFHVFRKAIYLAGALVDQGANHVHAPWADKCAFIAWIASRLAKVPYSVQARAHDLYRAKHRYAHREKFGNAEFIVTNCAYNESHIRSFLPERDWHKIHVIYEGIDLEEFLPVQQKLHESGPVRILSVARLIEEKGLVYLLQACKMLRDRGYAFTCQILGGPELPHFANYYVTLKKLHRALGLDDCVSFLGAQPFERVLAELGSADIFVLPCVMASDGSRDITPNALIEAMAMKLPVISTNLSGIPESVENGGSGILVPPKDEQALADALMQLIEDEDLRRELGERARKRVQERFDIKKNIARYVALFQGAG